MIAGLSAEERQLVEGMPDEVAKGFVEARRKAKGDSSPYDGMGGFFEEIFKQARPGR